MASTTQNTVREVLREAGPLTIDELVTRVTVRQPLTSKKPRQTLQNALTNDALCQRTADGRYVYLPAFVRGARMRVPMDLTNPAKGLLAAGTEVFTLLAPMAAWGESGPTPAFALRDGPVVTAEWQPGVGARWLGLRYVMRLPATFWHWWEEQQGAGADALIIGCEDGEASRYTVDAVRSADLGVGAVATRNAELREAAVAALKRTRGLWPADLAGRLLAQGVYHHEPPPDPLRTALFEPPGPFGFENRRVVQRPELTPGLRRLFAPRLFEELDWEDALVHELLDLPPRPEPELATVSPPRLPAPEHGYRVKVSLEWKPSVWRVIEILDNQTLEDLHLAIQRAFRWDNDHLYAFFLSGRAWDRVTEVAAPFGDAEPPTTDEVTLADLEVQPGQRFLYIFDFGDELRHEIEILDTFPAPDGGTFPRIAESHGQAPPQYPVWDEEAADEAWDDGAEDTETPGEE